MKALYPPSFESSVLESALKKKSTFNTKLQFPLLFRTASQPHTKPRTQSDSAYEQMMNRIFGLTMEETTVRWRKVCNEEFCNLYSSLNIIAANQEDEMGCKYRTQQRGVGNN